MELPQLQESISTSSFNINNLITSNISAGNGFILKKFSKFIESKQRSLTKDIYKYQNDQIQSIVKGYQQICQIMERFQSQTQK